MGSVMIGRFRSQREACNPPDLRRQRLTGTYIQRESHSTSDKLKAMSEITKTPVIDSDFLAILRCPACKSELILRNDERLFCAQCRRSYPVRDEIPILLIDEATIEPESPDK